MALLLRGPAEPAEPGPPAPPPPGRRPKVVGVLGGAFNPIHLGHVLLAVTVKETKPVDEVVLVPVFRHPVKTDLLPFKDRLAMCRRAVEGKGVHVSTVEEETGESNVAMLRALRGKYASPIQLLWVCGDDVFEWIDNPKGQGMMQELDGLIVQQRLHREGGAAGGDRFYKTPMDSARVDAVGQRHGLRIDFIFGELPHFSSTLVRSSPASWKAYLPQSVATYLDEHPDLVRQLVSSYSKEAPASTAGAPTQVAAQKDPKAPGVPAERDEHLSQQHAPQAKRPRICEVEADAASLAVQMQEHTTSCVMRCLAVVHSLQRERLFGSLALALGSADAGAAVELRKARAETDGLLREGKPLLAARGATFGMAEELAYAHTWLARDRVLLDAHLREHSVDDSPEGWLRRARLMAKMNTRIDTLIEMCFDVLSEQVASTRSSSAAATAGTTMAAAPAGHRGAPCAGGAAAWGCGGGAAGSLALEEGVPESHAERLLELFRLWSRGKEALGRERAFICAGGGSSPRLVRSSLRLRGRANEVIDEKDAALGRIFSLGAAGTPLAKQEVSTANAALQAMLVRVTAWEYVLMGAFAPSTPTQVVHHLLALGPEASLFPSPAGAAGGGSSFDIQEWVKVASAPVDLMKTFLQSLAAAICALAAQPGLSAGGRA